MPHIYCIIVVTLAQQVHSLRVCGDSKLVINQVAGKWDVKCEHLLEYHARATALKGQIADVTLEHQNRIHIARADALANRAIDDDMRGLAAASPAAVPVIIGVADSSSSSAEPSCASKRPASTSVDDRNGDKHSQSASSQPASKPSGALTPEQLANIELKRMQALVKRRKLGAPDDIASPNKDAPSSPSRDSHSTSTTQQSLDLVRETPATQMAPLMDRRVKAEAARDLSSVGVQCGLGAETATQTEHHAVPVMNYCFTCGMRLLFVRQGFCHLCGVSLRSLPSSN